MKSCEGCKYFEDDFSGFCKKLSYSEQSGKFCSSSKRPDWCPLLKEPPEISDINITVFGSDYDNQKIKELIIKEYINGTK